MADTIVLEIERSYGERNTEPRSQPIYGCPLVRAALSCHQERDTGSRYQRFEVPLQPNWMLLDAMNYIKDRLDGSVAVHWLCRVGICGVCGMRVNGVRKLTCSTPLMSYAPGPVRIAPPDRSRSARI